MLAAYNNNPWDIEADKITFKELYDLWLEKRAVKLGGSNRSSLKAAYTHCSKLNNFKYREIKSYQMQDCIDCCGCGYSTPNFQKIRNKNPLQIKKVLDKRYFIWYNIAITWHVIAIERRKNIWHILNGLKNKEDGEQISLVLEENIIYMKHLHIGTRRKNAA